MDLLKEKVSPSYSARFLKRALESNVCRVNGRIERFASARLEKGDRIELMAHWDEVGQKSASTIPILYEDDDLLILDKPAGVVCREEFFRKTFQQPLWLAHRLDKDTTGALLFAKKHSALEELFQQFEERRVKKEYLAFVDGVPREERGLIQSWFVKKGNFQGQTIWGSNPMKQGLFAETAWRRLSIAETKDAALLLCQPTTGRTHQIRIHLAEMGHPILIDRQYASHFRSRIEAARPLLHAYRLHLEWKGKSICVEAPIPNDLYSPASGGGTMTF